MALYVNTDGVGMKSKRTFYIAMELSESLDKISGPNGDGRTITWHLEQALKQYFAGHTLPPEQEVKPDNIKYSEDDVRLAYHIYQRVLSVAPKTKKPNMGKWADVIRLMRVSDSLDHEEIARVFDWANQDHFWNTNILSPSKLRKQFPNLHAKMGATHDTNQRPTQQRSSAVSRVRDAGQRQREEITARRNVLNNMGSADGHLRPQDRNSVRGADAGDMENVIDGSYTQTD